MSGHVGDAQPPNMIGPHKDRVSFFTRIELLGRPFENSRFEKTIDVQYPVQLGNLYCPMSVDRGDVRSFRIEVRNVSTLPYGSCNGSGGRVVLQLHFDSRLIPLGKTSAAAPYDLTYNHDVRDGTFVELNEIPPNSTITVDIQVMVERNAEYYNQLNWQADIRLRDKLIEYNQRSVRVSPRYGTQTPWWCN